MSRACDCLLMLTILVSIVSSNVSACCSAGLERGTGPEFLCKTQALNYLGRLETVSAKQIVKTRSFHGGVLVSVKISPSHSKIAAIYFGDGGEFRCNVAGEITSAKLER